MIITKWAHAIREMLMFGIGRETFHACAKKSNTSYNIIQKYLLNSTVSMLFS